MWVTAQKLLEFEPNLIGFSVENLQDYEAFFKDLTGDHDELHGKQTLRNAQT